MEIKFWAHKYTGHPICATMILRCSRVCFDRECNVAKVPKQSNGKWDNTRRAAVPSKEARARAGKLEISTSKAIYTFNRSLPVMYFPSVFRGKDVSWRRSSQRRHRRSPTFWIIFTARAALVKRKESLVPLIRFRVIHEWYTSAGTTYNFPEVRRTEGGRRGEDTRLAICSRWRFPAIYDSPRAPDVRSSFRGGFPPT